LLDAAAGGNRTLIISGEAGAGKSSLLAAIAARATERGFLAGHGTAAPVEGAWPYARSSRRSVEALCAVCQQDPGLLSGLAGPHREEIDRARNGTPLSLTDRSVTVTATCEIAGMVPEMATMIVLCLMWRFISPSRYEPDLPRTFRAPPGPGKDGGVEGS